MSGHTLEAIDQEKDLRVIIDDTLKFHAHTAAAAKQGKQILGVIRKAYCTRDALTVPILYKAKVRPTLNPKDFIPAKISYVKLNIVYCSFFRFDRFSNNHHFNQFEIIFDPEWTNNCIFNNWWIFTEKEYGFDDRGVSCHLIRNGKTEKKDPTSKNSLAGAKKMQTSQIRPKLPKLTGGGGSSRYRRYLISGKKGQGLGNYRNTC